MRTLNTAIVALTFTVCYLSTLHLLQTPVVAKDVENLTKAHAQVAIINLNKVLESDTLTTDEIRDLQLRFNEVKKRLATEKTELEALQTELNTREKGTAEHTQLATEITARRAAWMTEVEYEKAAFANLEAEVMLAGYWRIVPQAEAYAQQHGIRLVIQYQPGDVTTIKDRESLQRYLTQPIVYEDQVDITDAIIKRLKAANLKPATPPDFEN